LKFLLDKPTNSFSTDLIIESIPERRARLLNRSGLTRPTAHASRLIGLMKLLFPAAAVALVGLTFAWPQLIPDKGQFRIGENSVGKVDVDGLFIENPRYVGMDEQDRPYQISAFSAVQKNKSEDLIYLTAPKADIFLTASGWVAINSEKGIYHKSSEVLDLFGDVKVFYDKGYQFETETIKLDLRKGTGISNTNVRLHGKAGEIESEGFKISHNGTRVLFKGKSKAILRGSREGNL
jgi:lipopolysaccharide export system protein LptC